MFESSSIPLRRHRYGAITQGGDSRYVATTRSHSSDRYPDYARAHARTRYQQRGWNVRSSRRLGKKPAVDVVPDPLSLSLSLSLAAWPRRRQAQRRGRSPCGRSAEEKKGEQECKRDTDRRAAPRPRHATPRPLGRYAFDRPCAPSRSENNRFIVSA